MCASISSTTMLIGCCGCIGPPRVPHGFSLRFHGTAFGHFQGNPPTRGEPASCSVRTQLASLFQGSDTSHFANQHRKLIPQRRKKKKTYPNFRTPASLQMSPTRTPLLTGDVESVSNWGCTLTDRGVPAVSALRFPLHSKLATLRDDLQRASSHDRPRKCYLIRFSHDPGAQHWREEG